MFSLAAQTCTHTLTQLLVYSSPPFNYCLPFVNQVICVCGRIIKRLQQKTSNNIMFFLDRNDNKQRNKTLYVQIFKKICKSRS